MNLLPAAAMAYAERLGWPVFPLAANSKVPRAGSHGHREATTTLDQIRKWWGEYPYSNIGIRCSDFWVLDVDDDDGRDWLRSMERQHGELPRTVRQCTATRPNEHILFLNPADGRHVVNRSKFVAGCDTRSAEGYIVAAPSSVPEGAYAWSVDHHPFECEISEAPEWLLPLVTGPAPSSFSTGRPAGELATLIAAGVDEGARNATLTRLAGHLLWHYVDPYIAFELLKSWNQTSCRPPLPEKDVMTIAVSIAKKETARRRAIYVG